jgi:outer membrane protein assembly factor BamD
MMRMQLRLQAQAALLIAAAAGLVGCSQTSSFLRGQPNFFKTAQQNYDYAQKALKSGDYQTAAQFFQHIKSHFGFSKWATLAELGLADTNLGREKFTEAVDGFKQFMKAHPGNEHVLDGYAALKIGEAYYKQIPGDWFLVPPSYEKDQGPVHDAVRELSAFLEQYPDSPHAARGRKLYDECVRRVSDHELYVARFYLDQNRPYAAIGRLEGLVKKFPGAHQEPETMLLLGKTYLKMNKPDQARDVFEKLAAEHPTDFRAEKARLYLHYIAERFGH